MIIKFDVRQDYSFPVSSFVNDEALAFARFLVETGNDDGRSSYDADNYTELNAISPSHMSHRCIGDAPVLDEKSVRINACGGRDRTFVHYATTQKCLYFAPEGTPFEVATIMAAVAVACGDVEQSVEVRQATAPTPSVEICAPAGVPATALVETYISNQMNAYPVTVSIRKEASV